MINYSASTVPILQLALSGRGLPEQQLNDIGLNFLRTQLVTVPGAVVSVPIRGKQRQVMVDLKPGLLQSKGLAAARCGFRAEPTEPGASFRNRQNRRIRV